GTDPTMRAIAHGGSARFAGACPSETDTPLLGGQAVHRRRALAVEERLDLAAFGADPRDVEFRPQTDPLAFHSLLQPDDLVALLVEFDALPDQELQAAVVDVAQVRFARGLALELADAVVERTEAPVDGPERPLGRLLLLLEEANAVLQVPRLRTPVVRAVGTAAAPVTDVVPRRLVDVGLHVVDDRAELAAPLLRGEEAEEQDEEDDGGGAHHSVLSAKAVLTAEEGRGRGARRGSPRRRADDGSADDDRRGGEGIRGAGGADPRDP